MTTVGGAGRTPETELVRALIAIAREPDLFEKRVLALETAQQQLAEERVKVESANFESSSASAQAILDRERANVQISLAGEMIAAAKKDVATMRDRAAAEAAAVETRNAAEAARLLKWDQDLQEKVTELRDKCTELQTQAAHLAELQAEAKQTIALHAAKVTELEDSIAAANARTALANNTIESFRSLIPAPVPPAEAQPKGPEL